MREVMDIEDLLTKYKDELNKDSISGEVLEDVANTLKDTVKCKKKDFDFVIYIIYHSIIMAKYFSTEDLNDIGLIYNLMKYIPVLKFLMDDSNRAEFYINQSCEDMYTKLREEYPELPKEIPEELSIDNIMNAEYQFNNFRKYSPNDKEFIEELDKELWRYI